MELTQSIEEAKSHLSLPVFLAYKHTHAHQAYSEEIHTLETTLCDFRDCAFGTESSSLEKHAAENAGV